MRRDEQTDAVAFAEVLRTELQAIAVRRDPLAQHGVPTRQTRTAAARAQAAAAGPLGAGPRPGAGPHHRRGGTRAGLPLALVQQLPGAAARRAFDRQLGGRRAVPAQPAAEPAAAVPRAGGAGAADPRRPPVL